jgi:hypothetical protein
MARGGARAGAGRKPTSKATEPTTKGLPAKAGTLRKYTPAIAATICERLADGEGLKAICRSPDMPSASAVRQWAIDNHDGFGELYERARHTGLWSVADDLLEISDDGRNDWMQRGGDEGWVANGENVQRSRLRVDSRKWLLSKLLPKQFGDKIEQQITGAGGAPLASPTFNIAFVTTPPAADGTK